MTETTWLWIGVGGMALGAVLLAVVGQRRTRDEEGHTQIHVVVSLVAALAYFAMATGQGSVTLASGRELLFARYLDWSVTTPLLLLGLSMIALHGAHRRPGLVAALLGADVLMVLTGLFFALSEAAGPKWTWYLISCGAFLAVYATLFGSLRREARARDAARRVAYGRNVLLLTGLWLLYPVVDLLGPNGTQLWGAGHHHRGPDRHRPPRQGRLRPRHRRRQRPDRRARPQHRRRRGPLTPRRTGSHPAVGQAPARARYRRGRRRARPATGSPPLPR